MSHSYAQREMVTCPNCEKAFSADVWTIVDLAERPDLMEQILDGTLHQVPCPFCGADAAVDLPLLIYRPGEPQPLLFSPSQEPSKMERRAEAAGLVERLRKSVGEEWNNDWLAQVGLIDRESLAEELKAEQRAWPANMRSSALADKLQTFMQKETWLASQRYLEDHADLLSEAADRILQDLIRTSRERGEEDYVQVFEEHREVLRRCREVGVKEAFAERIRLAQGGKDLEEGVAAVQDFVHAQTWKETEDVLEAHPELLEERGDRLMAAFVEAARELGDEGSETVLQEHRALLQRCREVGIEEAFAEKMGFEEEETVDSLKQALQAFVSAETWNEAKAIVEAHPDLLREEVGEAITLLIDSAREEGEDETATILQEHREILEQCREVGIQEAFAQRIEESERSDSDGGEK